MVFPLRSFLSLSEKFFNFRLGKTLPFYECIFVLSLFFLILSLIVSSLFFSDLDLLEFSDPRKVWVVYVEGAVESPMSYMCKKGDLFNDILPYLRLLEGADTDNLLSQKIPLSPHQKIIIPFKKEGFSSKTSDSEKIQSKNRKKKPCNKYKTLLN